MKNLQWILKLCAMCLLATSFLGMQADAATRSRVANTAPVIAGAPAAVATVGVLYSFTPTASDADGDALGFSIKNKPAWATFNTATGALMGTPVSTSIGAYSRIKISVSDGKATTSLATFSINVSAASSAASSASSTSSASSSVASSSSSASSAVSSASSSSVSSSSSSSSSVSSSSSSSTSSSSSSASSSSSSASAGTLGHTGFTAVPQLTGGALANEWANGETRLIKDSNAAGSGEVFGFRWFNDDASARVYLFSSADNGASWSMVGSLSGTNYLYPYQVIATTQDSTGKVHMIARSKENKLYYRRFSLSYTSGRISGFSSEVTPIQIPDHSFQGNEARADIKIVKDATGAEQIVYALSLTVTSARTDHHVYMSRATSLTPTSSSQFVGLATTTAGDTQVFNSCVYSPYCNSSVDAAAFSNHLHTALFAQNEASKDLYLIEGPIDGDYGYAYATTEVNRLRAFRLVSSAAGWTLGAETSIAVAGSGIQPGLFSVSSGSSYAWVMYVHPTKGVTFGSFASDGVYNESSISSPDATQLRNGWGVFTVSSDDSKIWAIWDTLGYYDTGTGTNGRKAYQAYWNGSAWTKYSDANAADSMGMAGISGWKSGVCGLLFNGGSQGQTYVQPTAACIWGE